MEGMPEMIRLWKQVSSASTLPWNRFWTLTMDRPATEEDGKSIRDNPEGNLFAVQCYTSCTPAHNPSQWLWIIA